MQDEITRVLTHAYREYLSTVHDKTEARRQLRLAQESQREALKKLNAWVSHAEDNGYSAAAAGARIQLRADEIMREFDNEFAAAEPEIDGLRGDISLALTEKLKREIAEYRSLGNE